MKSSFRALLLVLLFGTGTALADPVTGVPVGEYGSSDPVGNVYADGTIGFYIPLTDTVELYGVSGGGTSSDTCSTYDGTCTGGALVMLLYFATSHTGDTQISLDFGDLDVAGVNDPWFLLESLLVFDAVGNIIATITSLADLAAGNNQNQLVDVVTSSSGPIYLGLVFFSDFAEGTPAGRYRNTLETVRATAVAVPEPETLMLLGLALLLLGAWRRKDLA